MMGAPIVAIESCAIHSGDLNNAAAAAAVSLFKPSPPLLFAPGGGENSELRPSTPTSKETDGRRLFLPLFVFINGSPLPPTTGALVKKLESRLACFAAALGSGASCVLPSTAYMPGYAWYCCCP